MISNQARQLGHALVAAKLLTPHQLQDLIADAEKEASPSLIVALLNYGYLTFKVFEKFLVQNLGIKSAVISRHAADPQLIKLITFDTIQRRMIYPLASRDTKDGKAIAMGMVDPLDTLLIKELERKFNVRIVPVLISLPDFQETLAKLVVARTSKDQAKIGAHVSFPDFSQQHATPRLRAAPAKPKAAEGEEQNREGENEIERFTRGSEVIPSLIHNHSPEKDAHFSESANETMSDTGSMNTNTLTVQPKPQMTRTIALEEKSFVTSQSKVTASFLGSNAKKFREEVIVKLDLSPQEARALTDEQYTRENLPAHLKKMNAQTLQSIYDSLPPEQKLEALANALMRAGFLDKSDLLISGALSQVFKEEKK